MKLLHAYAVKHIPCLFRSLKLSCDYCMETLQQYVYMRGCQVTSVYGRRWCSSLPAPAVLPPDPPPLLPPGVVATKRKLNQHCNYHHTTPIMLLQKCVIPGSLLCSFGGSIFCSIRNHIAFNLVMNCPLLSNKSCVTTLTPHVVPPDYEVAVPGMLSGFQARCVLYLVRVSRV